MQEHNGGGGGGFFAVCSGKGPNWIVNYALLIDYERRRRCYCKGLSGIGWNGGVFRTQRGGEKELKQQPQPQPQPQPHKQGEEWRQ